MGKAQSADRQLMTPRQVCEILVVPESTLRFWAKQRAGGADSGPPVVDISGSDGRTYRRYDRAQFYRWLEEREK